MKSSKRPRKYHLSINFLAQKRPCPHLQKVQNKDFPVITEYHFSINSFAKSRPYFPSSKSLKQELFNNQEISSFHQFFGLPYFPFLEGLKEKFFSNQKTWYSMLRNYHLIVLFSTIRPYISVLKIPCKFRKY